MADEDFQSGDSGASQTYPQQCSALRKNGYVNIKGRPCKIVEMSTSKTGKHGHAKVHLVGIDIFSGKKYEDICPSTHNMDVPNVVRLEFQVLSIEDDMVSLMNDKGDLKDDLNVPDGDTGADLIARVKKGEDLCVTVLSAMTEEVIVNVKQNTK